MFNLIIFFTVIVFAIIASDNNKLKVPFVFYSLLSYCALTFFNYIDYIILGQYGAIISLILFFERKALFKNDEDTIFFTVLIALPFLGYLQVMGENSLLLTVISINMLFIWKMKNLKNNFLYKEPAIYREIILSIVLAGLIMLVKVTETQFLSLFYSSVIIFWFFTETSILSKKYKLLENKDHSSKNIFIVLDGFIKPIMIYDFIRYNSYGIENNFYFVISSILVVLLSYRLFSILTLKIYNACTHYVYSINIFLIVFISIVCEIDSSSIVSFALFINCISYLLFNTLGRQIAITAVLTAFIFSTPISPVFVYNILILNTASDTFTNVFLVILTFLVSIPLLTYSLSKGINSEKI